MGAAETAMPVGLDDFLEDLGRGGTTPGGDSAWVVWVRAWEGGGGGASGGRHGGGCGGRGGGCLLGLKTGEGGDEVVVEAG